MITSEALDKFAPAFLKAQVEMDNAEKNSNNPAFRTKYANLEGVIDAVKPALNSNGITFIQTGSPSVEGRLTLTTRLLHSSGQWIQDTAECQLSKNDPQGFGSAVTYLRRYNLAAICGITQADDDGNSASSSQPAQRAATQNRTPAARGTAPSTLDRVLDILNGMDDDTADQWAAWMVKNKNIGTDKPREMTEAQLKELLTALGK